MVHGPPKKTIDFEKRWRPLRIHGSTLQVYFLDEQMISAGNVGEKSVRIMVGKEVGLQRRIKCFWTSRNSSGINGKLSVQKSVVEELDLM